jgi:hypothetical protein
MKKFFNLLKKKNNPHLDFLMQFYHLQSNFFLTKKTLQGQKYLFLFSHQIIISCSFKFYNCRSQITFIRSHNLDSSFVRKFQVLNLVILHLSLTITVLEFINSFKSSFSKCSFFIFKKASINSFEKSFLRKLNFLT